MYNILCVPPTKSQINEAELQKRKIKQEDYRKIEIQVGH